MILYFHPPGQEIDIGIPILIPETIIGLEVKSLSSCALVTAEIVKGSGVVSAARVVIENISLTHPIERIVLSVVEKFAEEVFRSEIVSPFCTVPALPV